ncbi:phage tail protein [Xenorhabdus bovienii]|uniref:Phage tail protein n=2 Tax=Xenorhabdus bovienii TaxID=40576 RepID=A0AAJ1N121_XENBV|nr:phage tail protein [Xenorhabdus bovienii]MDE1480414.1 phage tail protein [Xenorhabdus bovienii]MDE1488313.1 phage tail protein [Xenorhabdus bovienii]MDE1496605.1 phage tail protein [Xenorhabdus bovienii]MDE9447238.1 phage tail protein [Xenorhabdus bovienii]MDE9475486.1 phage tail protein [Xenorhabdus bovienii]
MKNLKAALLAPRSHVKAVEIFGTAVNLRRMTATELMDLEEAVEKLSEAGNGREASRLNVQIVLDCLVDDKGKPIPPGDLPTAEELMDAHDNATIIAAINLVKRHSIGTLEEAEKN